MIVDKKLTIAILMLISIPALSILSGCGDKASEDPPPAGTFLAEEFSGINVRRASEVTTYPDNSLWEYINGGAELYLKYGFVEVATADYKQDEVELVADIYRFDSSLGAYGLYSVLRPEGRETIRLGIEGIVSAASVEFVKGPYFVRLIGYEDTDETNRALINLAGELAGTLPGATDYPAGFANFPKSNRLPSTNKYWVESYLDLDFLGDVYSQDYLIDTGRVSLFYCASEAGEKVLRWSRDAENRMKLQECPKDLPFDDGKAFMTKDPLRGPVVVGIRDGKLVGMAGYTKESHKWLKDWLTVLPQDSTDSLD